MDFLKGMGEDSLIWIGVVGLEHEEEQESEEVEEDEGITGIGEEGM